MSYEAVNIYLVDKTPQKNPLAGAIVKILSTDGKLVYTQAQANSNGLVNLLLPAPFTYQARFYMFGVSFDGAQLLNVQPAPATNEFIVRGDKYVQPSSFDPRICIASGFFRTPSGAIAAGVDMHFIGKFDPLLLDGAAILPERVIKKTDQRGYVEVPLIRFAQYDVTLAGMEDYQRMVSVPDAPAVNIGDLIFPVVSAIDFEEDGPYTVGVGSDLTVHPHVFTSDLRELEDVTSDLLWSTSDSTGLGLNPTPNAISVHAVRAGTYTLTAVRKDQSVVRIPNTPITGVPITITVTP